MTMKTFNALETADDLPAEAGTPNLKSTPNQGKSSLIRVNQGKNIMRGAQDLPILCKK